MLLAFRLVAHGIGGRTVMELYEGPDANEEGMGVEEFLGWAAYLQLEPLAEQRADAHTAMMMAQQYNMNRGKGKPAKKPAVFMPVWFKPPKRPMGLDELEYVMRRQATAMGISLDEID